MSMENLILSIRSLLKKPVFDFEISSSLSFDNIFHHLNQVFYFQRISLNHHPDSLVHRTIKSLPPFISTISTRFLLHLNHQSSIQHHPTHYLVTMSVLSSITLHLHLFLLSFILICRVIHFHLINIHFKLLSSVSNSLVMYNHYH
jgi:hypothetical protein